MVSLLASDGSYDWIVRYGDALLNSLNAGSVLGNSALVIASDASPWQRTTGATLQALGAPVWVCDGTDDNSQTQAAIDFLTGGGTILHSEGTFNWTGAVNPLSNQHITGMGDSTVINLQTAAANGFYVNTKQGVRISNMKIASDAIKSDGAAVFWYACQYVYLDHIFFEDQYWAVRQTGTTVSHISDCRMYDNVYGAIGIDGAGVDLFLDNLSIAQPGNVHATVGIYLNGLSGLYINNVAIGSHNYSVQALPGALATVENVFASNLIMDHGDNYGLYISTEDGGTLTSWTFMNSWIATFGLGAYIKGVSGFSWDNGVIVNVGQHGLELATGTSKASVRGSKFYAVGNTAANTYSDIAVDAGVSYFTIQGNQCSNTGWSYSTTPQCHVLVAVGGSDHYSIQGNLAIGAAGTANFSDGGTGVNKVVANNVD